MDDIFVKIKKVGGSESGDKTYKISLKNTCTWKDSTPNTVFLD